MSAAPAACSWPQTSRASTHTGWPGCRRTWGRLGEGAHSNHSGIAGSYARLAAEQGLIGLSVHQRRSSVAPAGANQPFLGANPLAVAVPTAEPSMLLIDMATSAVATGKLEIAARAGAPIPPPGGELIGTVLDVRRPAGPG